MHSGSAMMDEVRLMSSMGSGMGRARAWEYRTRVLAVVHTAEVCFTSAGYMEDPTGKPNLSDILNKRKTKPPDSLKLKQQGMHENE